MKNEMSQMMRSYLQLKENYKDCIVFYRLGDFYEMFFDDAVLVSRLLDLTLTGRNCGLEERAPMCGVPYHAVDSYLAKLIAMGYKVAVCEQLKGGADAAKERAASRRKVVLPVPEGAKISARCPLPRGQSRSAARSSAQPPAPICSRSLGNAAAKSSNFLRVPVTGG